MASPALYWTTRTVAQHKGDILNVAGKVMKDAGLTKVSVKQHDTSGRTENAHAFVAPLHKKDPPSAGPGLGTTAPATYIVMFCAAGSDAKAVRDKIIARWDKINWL